MSIQGNAPWGSVPRIRRRDRGQHASAAIQAISFHLHDALVTVEMWRQTARQRRALARLDQRMLNDIGLTKDQVMREISRPPWDV